MAPRLACLPSGLAVLLRRLPLVAPAARPSMSSDRVSRGAMERPPAAQMPASRRGRRRDRRRHAGRIPRFRAEPPSRRACAAWCCSNSPGGNVVASMELGMVVPQARHVPRSSPASATTAQQSGPVAGVCVSACVYAFYRRQAAGRSHGQQARHCTGWSMTQAGDPAAARGVSGVRRPTTSSSRSRATPQLHGRRSRRRPHRRNGRAGSRSNPHPAANCALAAGSPRSVRRGRTRLTRRPVPDPAVTPVGPSRLAPRGSSSVG